MDTTYNSTELSVHILNTCPCLFRVENNVLLCCVFFKWFYLYVELLFELVLSLQVCNNYKLATKVLAQKATPFT